MWKYIIKKIYTPTERVLYLIHAFVNWRGNKLIVATAEDSSMLKK